MSTFVFIGFGIFCFIFGVYACGVYIIQQALPWNLKNCAERDELIFNRFKIIDTKPGE